MSKFGISMDVYTDNHTTGHRDRFVKRVYREFDSPEKLSQFWESNKKLERKGKNSGRDKRKAKKRAKRQRTNDEGGSDS